MGIENIDVLKPGEEVRLSVSQELTKRAQVLRTAEELAEAAQAHIDEPSSTTLEVLEFRVQSYKEAKGS